MKKFIECSSYKTARRIAPWASRIVKVSGGFIAFEYVDGWLTWKGQR